MSELIRIASPLARELAKKDKEIAELKASMSKIPTNSIWKDPKDIILNKCEQDKFIDLIVKDKNSIHNVTFQRVCGNFIDGDGNFLEDYEKFAYEDDLIKQVEGK